MIPKQHPGYCVQQEEWQRRLLLHLDNMEMLIRAALRARNKGEQALAHCYVQSWQVEKDAYINMVKQRHTPTPQSDR